MMVLEDFRGCGDDVFRVAQLFFSGRPNYEAVDVRDLLTELLYHSRRNAVLCAVEDALQAEDEDVRRAPCDVDECVAAVVKELHELRAQKKEGRL